VERRTVHANGRTIRRRVSPSSGLVQMRRIEEDAVSGTYCHEAIAPGVPGQADARSKMLVVACGHRKRVGNAAFALEVDSGGRVRIYNALQSLVEERSAEEWVFLVGVIGSKERLPAYAVIQSEMRSRFPGVLQIKAQK